MVQTFVLQRVFLLLQRGRSIGVWGFERGGRLVSLLFGLLRLLDHLLHEPALRLQFVLSLLLPFVLCLLFLSDLHDLLR